MQNKTRIGLLVAGAALVVIVLAFLGPYHSHSVKPSIQNQQYDPNQAAQRIEARGIMSREDYLKLATISSSIQATRAVSNSDLDFLLGLSNSKPLRDSASNETLLHTKALSPLVQVKSYTPTQKDEVLKKIAPLLSSREAFDRTMGVIVLSSIDDPRATAYLKSMTNDPNADTRKHAADALQRIPS